MIEYFYSFPEVKEFLEEKGKDFIKEVEDTINIDGLKGLKLRAEMFSINYFEC